jgi:hypothetical protein
MLTVPDLSAATPLTRPRDRRDRRGRPGATFRPDRGDVLAVDEVGTAPEHLTFEAVPYYHVWYRYDDLLCRVGVYARSALVVDASTANEQALSIVRDRMTQWLRLRNAGPNVGLYSRTSMANDVAPWLDLGDALRLCERAGWPDDVTESTATSRSSPRT